MSETVTMPGKTTIAPDVLLTIARLTALSVPGVARLASVSGGVDTIFKGVVDGGVRVVVDHGIVNVDIYVILQRDVNVREVCRNIQAHIARAISEMVGMEVGRVNIHVEDINVETNV